MSDDAVAPVIAVMLILAAAVTFLAIFNGIYIPSLKQSSETEHLRAVESAFLHLSSDIERAVGAGQDRTTLSETVQLGGGDVFLNTLKSGGSLSVLQEPAVYNLTLYDRSENLLGTMNGTLVTLSYDPVGNFWQEQGYRWQEGFLHVTKYGTRQVPLSYHNMTDVSNEFGNTGALAAFAGSFGDVEYAANQTLYPYADPVSGTVVSYSPREGNCSRILFRAVNLTASPDHPFSSGNGFGKFGLVSRVESVTYTGVTFITVASDGRPFGNAVFRSWNESLSRVAGQCRCNVVYEPGYSDTEYSLYTIYQQVNPVEVTLDVVNIEIGAY
jgi:FlaG/FlaF family flagellin (archaellin)